MSMTESPVLVTKVVTAMAPLAMLKPEAIVVNPLA